MAGANAQFEVVDKQAGTGPAPSGALRFPLGHRPPRPVVTSRPYAPQPRRPTARPQLDTAVAPYQQHTLQPCEPERGPALAPAQRAEPAAAAGGAPVKRKREEYESELLDRLLNTAAPPGPGPVARLMALPPRRMLLAAVVLALMGAPLLALAGGRLHARHALRASLGGVLPPPGAPAVVGVAPAGSDEAVRHHRPADPDEHDPSAALDGEEALRREQWEARAAGRERQQRAVAANGAGRSLRSAVPERSGHAMRPTPVAACIVCRLLV
ncbi:hypothetical protein WJX81_001651 [Elliptochloris bilobata]|uniref:Uncharacterized protein n=1 Tax=Elliptochloris bilobata TaxID=381761 RepID=A0AAW1RZM1_9CHLO